MKTKNKEGANSTDITVVRRSLSTLTDASEVLVIEDAGSLTVATALLSQLNSLLDQLVADKEKIIKPINASLKEIRNKYRPTEEVLNASISSIREKMSQYATAAKAREEEAILAISSRVLPGKGNLSLESAAKRMELVEKVEKVEVIEGSVSFRPKQVLNIFSRISIPREYLIVDEDLVFADLKAGKVVEGAILDTIMVPFNSRN